MLGWARSQGGLRLPPAALTALGRCLFLHKGLVEQCLGGDGGLLLLPTHRPSQTWLEAVCPGDGQVLPAWSTLANRPEPGVRPPRAPLPMRRAEPYPSPPTTPSAPGCWSHVPVWTPQLCHL